MTGHDKNQFRDFIIEYYNRCVDALPKIEVVGAKWPYKTMIPDLSDFDGRIIASNDVTPPEWAMLDTAIGNIHYDMVVENPEWARFLEHPVGICVTWEEAFADDIYHPETIHWSAIMGDHARFKELLSHLRAKPWDDRQEYYYLHRFLTYYSPYLHDIDPPINLGAWEKEYALHSRCLHYFVPAMQAALCLVKKKPVRCKFETIYGWKELMPEEEVFDRILDMVDVKYDVPERDEETLMLEFEDDLWVVLQKAMAMVRRSVTLMDMTDNADIVELKKRVGQRKVNPLMHIFNGVRFSRVRKGRYQFYLREPKPFDSKDLIAGEFNWLRNFFTRTVYQAYGQIKLGEDDAPLDAIIEAMKPDLTDDAGADVIRMVHALAWEKFEKGNERALLERVAPVYAEYHTILERLLSDARGIMASTANFPR